MKSLLKPFAFLGYVCFYLTIIVYYLLYSVYYTLRIALISKYQGEPAAAKYARSKGVELSRRCYRWFRISLNIEGMDNLPKDTSYLLISNHLSAFDAAVVYGFINPEAFFIVKKEIESYPLLGVLAKRMAVFIDREDPLHALGALRKSMELLKEGKSVAVFPEGTRSLDGNIGPFAKGSLRIGMMTKKPIVPVVLTGNENIMPKGTLFIKRADVRVRVLPPVDPTQFKKEEELIEFVRNEMIEQLKSIKTFKEQKLQPGIVVG
jgi:1-acyl-sn-glycerol-3-phosphate acyltransferase